MTGRIELEALLSHAGGRPQQAASFALLALGIVESLASGSISPADAVRLFFHADNGLFVRRVLKDKIADQIMGRGVQLPDLIEALSAEEAHREFQRELATLRSLCLKAIETQQIAV